MNITLKTFNNVILSYCRVIFIADFSQSAGSIGLKVSWSKTKVQCLGRAVSQSGVFVEGQGVGSVPGYSAEDSNCLLPNELAFPGVVSQKPP